TGTGQQLVDVGLVPGVPKDPVLRAVENAVKGQRQLNDAEIGSQVAPRLRHGGDQELADLLGEGAQLGIAQGAQIGWSANPIEDRSAGNLVHRRCSSLATGFALFWFLRLDEPW